MKDRDIEELRQRPHRDIKAFTYCIMERMEEKYGNQFYEKLIDALNEAKRLDIIRILRKHNLI